MAFGLGNHAHLVTQGDELTREKVRDRFDPSRAGKKMVRSEQNSHGGEGSITRVTKNQKTP